MGSAKSGPSAAWFDKFVAHGQAHMGQITMTLHNYRSRQVHETSNGVNPSSSFRDMRSAKSGRNLWQIWQVFGPWSSPYGVLRLLDRDAQYPALAWNTMNDQKGSRNYKFPPNFTKTDRVEIQHSLIFLKYKGLNSWNYTNFPET